MRVFAMVVAAHLVLIASGAAAQERKKDTNQGVSFAKDVYPILKASCLECHNAGKKKGKLDLSSYDALKRGGESGAAFVAGDPVNSLLLSSISGKEPDMPKKKTPLDQKQVDLVTKWIKEGAKNDEKGNLGNSMGKDGLGKKGNESNGGPGNEGKARTAGVEEGNGDRDNGKKGNRIRRGDGDDDDDDDGIRGGNGRRKSRGEEGEDEDSRGRRGQGRRSGDD